MGKKLRLLTERDFEGMNMPRNSFDSLVIAAQVAGKIYNAEKFKEKEQKDNDNLQCATTQVSPLNHSLHERCSLNDKKEEKIWYNLKDNRRSVKHKIGECKSGMNAGSSSSDVSGVKADNAKKKRKSGLISAPVQQNLKPEFLSRIQDMGGHDIKLVIEKDLFTTNLVRRENRFSVPLNQVREDAKDFLTEDEKNTLEKRTRKNRVFTLEVPLMEPNLEMTRIKLRKWKMNNVYLYLLRGKWYEIGVRNELEAGNRMQLWSFRVQEQLHLALVNLSKDYMHEN